jgi:predicted ester cyclase
MPSDATTTGNIDLVRAFVHRVFDDHDPEAVVEYFSPDATWHGGSLGDLNGSAAIADLFKGFFEALPDLAATELDLVTGHDTVWVRFSVQGTDRGGMFGRRATGTKVRWEETDIYRVTGGKIVEEWSAADVSNILHQIGAYTPPWMA